MTTRIESPAFDAEIDAPPPYSRSERDAMRAYLQRTEVRLSTLHRIAVAFISGAGLLVLFPVFFKEEIVVIIRIFLTHISEALPMVAGQESILLIVLYLFLAYPFILSCGIPLYALYIMLKDVVHFYFSIYTPGFPVELETPSFAMTGITFAPDESESVKREVLRYQYSLSSVNFAIPFSAEKRAEYFDETIAGTGGQIFPASRRMADLEANGVIPADADRKTVEHFNAAFGLARTIDRGLSQEVAAQEVSVVRHVLYLRRLVLRYMKTLLMFIWTSLISFVMIPFLQEESLPTLMVLALGYLIWAALTMPIMRMPIRWIYRHRKDKREARHVDRQLVILETQVQNFVRAAVVTSLLAVVLSAAFYLL
jgi:hypothetical protein